MITQADKSGPSGYTALPHGVVWEDRTGQSSLASELLALDGSLQITWHDWSFEIPAQCLSYLPSVLGDQSDPESSSTSYRKRFIFEGPVCVVSTTCDARRPSFLVRMFSDAPYPPRQTGARNTASVTPAEELRATSGLTSTKLAELFGVSRPTYHKWLKGATPRNSRFQHLLDVLAHVKDARRSLASSEDCATWLRAPISAGGSAPLDYLRTKRFSTFRGLLVRVRSAEMKLTAPMPSVIGSVPDRNHLMVARARISPPPRIESDEPDDRGPGR